MTDFIYAHIDEVDHPPHDDHYPDSGTQHICSVANYDDANVVTSMVPLPGEVFPFDLSPGANINRLHCPVIDIDFPVAVYPSSQRGHYHLYVYKPMTFFQYAKILQALYQAGVVEEGFMQSFNDLSFSSVRTVHVSKPGVDATAAGLLRRIAMLERQLFEANQLLNSYSLPQ